jgi:hypothetical protein
VKGKRTYRERGGGSNRKRVKMKGRELKRKEEKAKKRRGKIQSIFYTKFYHFL